mmetsp:Transcript_10558/g.21388  ORF Transcript_10558/g.21388 Transcript_10558/m.21388 type:complete len:243 (-) Transcript_10558:72-800(-)
MDLAKLNALRPGGGAGSRPARLAVFDFDETLAVSTGWPGSDPVGLFGGKERLSELSALLDALREAGVTVAVCTFNRADCVTLLLRKANLLQYFEKCGPLMIGEEIYEENGLLWEAVRALSGSRPRSLAYNKGFSIRQLMMPLVSGHTLDPSGAGGRVEPGQLLFVDDDPGNCRNVASAIPGCTVVLVKQGAGMQAAEFAAVREWASAMPLDRANEAVPAHVPSVPSDPKTDPFSVFDRGSIV